MMNNMRLLALKRKTVDDFWYDINDEDYFRTKEIIEEV
jgi:hypothetical protein